MMIKKQDLKIYQRWYFWLIILGALLAIILALVLGLNNSTSTQKVTICTQMDYQGDIGPCIKKETVEIVASPDNQSECPVGTEPAYDVVGGIVGVKFVGCTKSK